jgi:hypothetical protein
MKNNLKIPIQKILFGLFVACFIVIFFLTIIAIFTNSLKIDEEFKKPLFYSVIIAVVSGIVSLFYFVFGMKQGVEGGRVNTVTGLDIDEDNPFEAPVTLNGEVQIEESVIANFLSKKILGNQLKEKLIPKQMMLIYESAESSNQGNVVFIVQDNPLPKLNMTLAEYMEFSHDMINSILPTNAREVRIGQNNNIAIQWYNAILHLPDKTTREVQQVQKLLIKDNCLIILQLTMTPKTSPENKRMFYEICENFGIEQSITQHQFLPN